MGDESTLVYLVPVIIHKALGLFNMPLEGFIATVLVIISICHDSS